MKKLILSVPGLSSSRAISFTLLAVVLLTGVGCGGGGGGGGAPASTGETTPTTSSPPGTAAINAVVAGTTVIVVDGSGAIVALDDTAGRPRDVDTNGDGIDDAYSVSLEDLPLNETLRLFLVSEGRILEVTFDGDGDGVPEANSFELSESITLELGVMILQDAAAISIAVPELNPTANAAVVNVSSATGIPTGVQAPPTEGFTVADLNTRGFNALEDGWIGGASTYFKAANVLAGAGVSNDADIARYFSALTGLWAFAANTFPDGDSSGLDSVADLLDLFGVANDASRGSLGWIEVPSTLPSDSPTGTDLREFLYAELGSELDGSITALGAVSASFSSVWSNVDTGESVESDQGDALFFTGVLQTIATSITILAAHSLALDIDEAANTSQTVQGVLANNATLLSISIASRLAEAGLLAVAAIDSIDAAIVAIDSETDDQTDDLITLDAFTVADITDARQALAQYRMSITSGSTQIDTNLVLDLQTFFGGNVDFRQDALLPAFQGNNVVNSPPPCFPDPTLSGMVAAPDLNADSDANNVCDRLE